MKQSIGSFPAGDGAGENNNWRLDGERWMGDARRGTQRAETRACPRGGWGWVITALGSGKETLVLTARRSLWASATEAGRPGGEDATRGRVLGGVIGVGRDA